MEVCESRQIKSFEVYRSRCPERRVTNKLKVPLFFGVAAPKAFSIKA
jgi:hypothetical protein